MIGCWVAHQLILLSAANVIVPRASAEVVCVAIDDELPSIAIRALCDFGRNARHANSLRERRNVDEGISPKMAR